MPKDELKPKTSIWGPEHWLPHTVTALALAILAGALAVIAGWWGLLLQALQGKQYTQLILNTAGVLFLLVVVLSYSLYRKIKVSSRPQIVAPVPPPKIEVRRLHGHQERLLIEAANRGISPSTLVDLEKIHPEESKFHFKAVSDLRYLDGHSSHSRLSDHGRAYLMMHKLMPAPDTARSRVVGPSVSPGGAVPLPPNRTKQR